MSGTIIVRSTTAQQKQKNRNETGMRNWRIEEITCAHRRKFEKKNVREPFMMTMDDGMIMIITYDPLRCLFQYPIAIVMYV